MKKLLLLSLVCVLGLFGNLRAQETITIGSSESSSYRTPINTDQSYSISEQIYTAAEIGKESGKIAKIAFKWASTIAETRNVAIYMQNTTQSSFGNWIPVSDSDKVYEGEMNINSEWVEITFTTKFEYTGGNLLLCIHDKTGSMGMKSNFCNYTTSAQAQRAISAQGGNAINPANPSSTGHNLTQRAFNNHIKLTFAAEGAEVKPAAPANLAAEVLSDTEIQLTWDAVENALTYNVYQGDVEIKTALQDTTFTVENLTPGTNYCFTVTAVNDLESDKSAQVCETTEATPAAATTFVFDFNDGTKDGLRVFHGPNAGNISLIYPDWGTPQDNSTVDLVINQLKNRYKGVDGSIAVYSVTYDMMESGAIRIPDNYIVTEKPYLITETSTIEWDIRQAEEGKTDHYSIVVSEDGTNFTDIWFERYSDMTGATKAYSLATYAGKEIYIGFHHYKQTDGGALCLDNVKLVTDSQIEPEDEVDFTAPTIPDGLKAVVFSETEIKLTWNVSENTSSYNIYIADSVIATSIAETTYMVENLTPGTTYCFTIVAVNEEKVSAKSTEICATTKEAAPITLAAPTNLKAELLVDEAKIKLTWDAVENAKLYQVYKNNVLLVEHYSETECTITHELQSGIEYCFEVVAICDGVVSEKSNKACVTTEVEEGVEKPATPQNFTIKALVPGELALSWDAVAGATEYNIYEADTLIGIVKVTNVDLDGLGSEKEYCFEVTAVNTGGESERTDKVCETTLKIEEPVVLAVPQNLTAEALIHNEIRLSWDSVAGATGYKVYQFEELLGEVKNTTADIYSLADSTQYCFKVTAINATGESEKSNEACATTLDPVQPEQPEEPGEGVEENATAFNIYPNPVNDKLYIETQTQTLTVEIYDVYGRQQSMVNGQQSTVIDVTSLNSGIYFVKVVTENGETVQRFVKK